ncbi:MAG: glyoxalase [bacterium]|nr:glyoxalase [bacterium]
MTVRFDAIGMVVTEMAATLAFYRMLDLEITSAADNKGHAEAVLPGGIRLMWDTVEVVQSFSEWEPPQGGHRMAVAFLCNNPDAVDAKYRELVGAGHRGHVAPFDAFWGQRYATVLDPDGNPVDLFAALPT